MTLCPCHPSDELETKKVSAGNRVETNTHLLLPAAGAGKTLTAGNSQKGAVGGFRDKN